MKIEHHFKIRLKRLLSQAGYAVRRSDELTALADKFGSDKGNMAYSHGYARIYHRLFYNLKDKPIVFVEIGLQRTDIDKRRSKNGAEGTSSALAHDAPSLRMWRRYFQAAKIFGFDVDDFSGVFIDRCQIVQGDMSSVKDLSRLVAAVGRSIDILIDDGSHASHHQQIALGTLFGHMSSGGMYIIEDLHWQDPSLERANTPKTRDIFRQFLSTGNIESPHFTASQQEYLQRHIRSLTLFDSLTTSVDDPTDALAVLIKN